MRIDKNTTIRLGDRNIVKVKLGDVVIWQKDNIDYLYIQNTYAGENTITFTTTQSGTPASGTYATSVEYSKDKITWNTLTFNTSTPQTITVGVGEKLYLRNNTGVFNFHDARNGNVDYYTSITSTNTINVGGNTNSLFDYTNMSGVDVSSTVGGLCRLFNQSVNLINANDIVIPQTTYPDFFLDEMFNHCESLVTTPNLNNVVNIGLASCSQMFGYCYSLVTPPDFNSVTYTGIRAGFSWCFYDCTSLTRTPSFNSLTSIGPLGFNKAFANCSNLTDIMFDTSSITNLPESAFNQSFMNTKIETGLHLGNVTELGKTSLYSLYRGCSFLSVVYCPNVSSWDESITRNWLLDAGTSVSGTKTAYKYSDISIPTSDSGIPSGWTVVKPVDKTNYFYVENTYAGGNTISVKQTLTGSPDSSLYAKTLQYSKDKNNWTTITLSSTTHNINLNQGERVYFRGNEGVLNYYANDGAIQAITNILGTQTHTIGGNINTLVNYITPNELTLTQGVFAGLFQNNTTITSAENLTLPPSSDGSLSNYSYYLMFSGCSALITPPSEIPATKQGHASCGKMFSDCIQLKTPPALKSTILGNYCFKSIFKNCTSLISAPELPALTLTPNCYQSAFEGCTSLVNPPQLPATEMKPNCYRNLFFGCTSLVNAPELPATTLAEGCYRSLFNGCTSLTTAPDLLAPTLVSYCYAYLFNACTSLNSVKCTATSGVGLNNSTAEWLWNVSPTGTFTKESGATWETGVSGIPSGWTVVNS